MKIWDLVGYEGSGIVFFNNVFVCVPNVLQVCLTIKDQLDQLHIEVVTLILL